MRPSCYVCKYSTIDRVSDITIGDFWGIEKSRPEIDDNTGVSLVIVNSSKGYEFFCKACEDMECFETTMDEALQPQLRHPTKKPEKSEEFWRDYKNRPFSYIVYKYGKGGATGIAKQLAINALEKLHLYETLHSVWMKIKGVCVRQ